MGARKAQTTEIPRLRNVRGEGDRLRGEIIDAAVKVLAALGPEDVRQCGQVTSVLRRLCRAREAASKQCRTPVRRCS